MSYQSDRYNERMREAQRAADRINQTAYDNRVQDQRRLETGHPKYKGPTEPQPEHPASNSGSGPFLTTGSPMGSAESTSSRVDEAAFLDDGPRRSRGKEFDAMDKVGLGILFTAGAILVGGLIASNLEAVGPPRKEIVGNAEDPVK